MNGCGETFRLDFYFRVLNLFDMVTSHKRDTMALI